MSKKTDGQSASPARGVHAASATPARRTVKRDESRAPQAAARPSALVDYCGDNLEQLAKLSDACVDLIYIDPLFNSNRNYGPCRTGQHWGLPREITPRATTPHRLRCISRGETKE